MGMAHERQNSGGRGPITPRDDAEPTTEDAMTRSEETEKTSWQRPAHGQLVYVQIPALDVTASAQFYERIFGWSVDPPDTGFEAPGLIGQWVTDRPAAPDAGPLAWIAVTDLDQTLELAASGGGEVVDQPYPDGPVRILASLRDPAGNLVGVVGHR
jgi:predicted enzyme related to lactoylglutathione lyase